MDPNRRWWQTAVVTCLAFVLACLWPYAVRAQEPPPAPPPQAPPPQAPPQTDETLQQAKGHFEAGKNAYNAGDYTTAINEFKAAEKLRPSPILDFNIGLANEKLNKKRVAVKYYKRYLQAQPDAQNRATVEASIAQLEREIAAQPPPAGVPPGQQPPPQVETPADNPPPQAPPVTYQSYDPYQSTGYPAQPGVAPAPVKKKSYWWVALIVVGGALLLTGVIVAAVVLADTSTTYYYERSPAALSAPPSAQNPSQRSPGVGPSIFSF